jgi:malonate transporter and related proteins
MSVSTFLHSVSVLLPVLFVMALGFWAGRVREFDQDQLDGLTELVLKYALPATLFVGVVSTPHSALVSAGPFLIALLGSFAGLFIVIAAISVLVLRHSVGAAALQAQTVSFANFGFIGAPIFSSLFGASGTVPVAITGLVVYMTTIPVTVVMLEYQKRRATPGETRGLRAVVGQAVIDSLKQPVVWAPLLATILVLTGVPVPRALETMLDQIGSATAGVGLFASGLIIAACHAKVTAESLGNSFLKMVVQPVLMGLLVMILGVARPLGTEGIVMCALPTAAVPVMLALNYHVYESEAASTMLLTTLAMVINTPIAIAWTRL